MIIMIYIILYHFEQCASLLMDVQWTFLRPKLPTLAEAIHFMTNIQHTGIAEF